MFIRKVLDHLLNQVLVESLANSRLFQRFAVWSHGAMKELTEKSKNSTVGLDDKFSKFAEVAKQQSERLRREFEQEMSRQSSASHQQIKRGK